MRGWSKTPQLKNYLWIFPYLDSFWCQCSWLLINSSKFCFVNGKKRKQYYTSARTHTPIMLHFLITKHFNTTSIPIYLLGEFVVFVDSKQTLLVSWFVFNDFSHLSLWIYKIRFCLIFFFFFYQKPGEAEPVGVWQHDAFWVEAAASLWLFNPGVVGASSRETIWLSWCLGLFLVMNKRCFSCISRGLKYYMKRKRIYIFIWWATRGRTGLGEWEFTLCEASHFVMNPV